MDGPSRELSTSEMAPLDLPGMLPPEFRSTGEEPSRALASRSSANKPLPHLACQGPLDWLLLTLREFVLVLDPMGVVQHLWTCHAEFLHTPDILLGRRLADLLDPGAFSQLWTMFDRAVETGAKQYLQYSIRVAGRTRRFMVCVAAARSASHSAPVFCMITRDHTELIKQMEELEKSEALLAQAEEIATMGSFEFDPSTGKVWLSKGLRRIHGAPEEWSPEAYWACLHPEDRERCQAIVHLGEAECKPYEYTARYLGPEGKFRTKFGRGLPIAGPDGKWKRTIGIVQDITEHARAEEELRKLSWELLRARDDDRRLIARELHETAGQSLAALKMTLGRLRDAVGARAVAPRDLLASASQLVDDVTREVRTVSYLMHPPLLDEAGLGSAVRWYAEGFTKRSGIPVSVEVPDDFGRYSQEIETTIFRVLQEALTNVHRYSGSPNATIRLVIEQRNIVAEVRDEGSGLRPSNVAPNGQTPYGVGIAGMRERVKHANGTFELDSVPGRGTTVRAILPIPSAQHETSATGDQIRSDAQVAKA